MWTANFSRVQVHLDKDASNLYYDVSLTAYEHSCRLLQPDQRDLWCCLRILHWWNMSHNVWWCQVSEMSIIGIISLIIHYELFLNDSRSNKQH